MTKVRRCASARTPHLRMFIIRTLWHELRPAVRAGLSSAQLLQSTTTRCSRGAHMRGVFTTKEAKDTKAEESARDWRILAVYGSRFLSAGQRDPRATFGADSADVAGQVVAAVAAMTRGRPAAVREYEHSGGKRRH
jgi:hypothetical protein